MSVSEYERHQLFTWFEENMGRERAATMMNLVPPVGWAEVATRRDLDELEARLSARIDALDERLSTRIDALDERLSTRIDTLDAQLTARIEASASGLEAKMGALRSDLLRTFGTWLFLSQAAVIAAVSVLVALD